MQVLWTVLGTALMVLGTILFTVIYAATHGGEAGGVIGPLGIAITMLLVLALLVLHEWIHGLAMRRYDARPEYGAGVLNKFLPYFYCTAPSHEFTRAQFAVVSAAPMVIISLVGALCVAFAPFGGWLVVPLGAHLGGCIGDLWFLGILSRHPRGTLLEDLKTGVRFHYPAARGAC